MTSRFARHKNPNWGGGRIIDTHGYVKINVGLDHPMASASSPYVGEHRLVMAEKLGRSLSSDEIVHHLDGDKQNNDPDNLVLVDRATHMRRHYAGQSRPSAKLQKRANGRWIASPKTPLPPRKKGPQPTPLISRMLAKIDVSGGEDACHPWLGTKSREGYGMIYNQPTRRKERAHRMMYEILHGPITDPELVVRHTCDNPPCCNPKHLLLGTRKQNAEDRGKRKRGREHRQSGEANTNAKLFDADVARVFAFRDQGWTQVRIAAEVGVKQPQVSRILNGASRSGVLSEP